jgi:hypothetical protein
VAQPVAHRLVDLISRTALAAVAFPKTGANAHRLIVAIAFSILNHRAAALAFLIEDHNACQARCLTHWIDPRIGRCCLMVRSLGVLGTLAVRS